MNNNFDEERFDNSSFEDNQDKRKRRRTLYIAVIIFLVSAITIVITAPYLLKRLEKSGEEKNDNKVVAVKDKEDAIFEEIKRLTKYLYNNEEYDTLRNVLGDLGYGDIVIDDTIDEYQDIIDSIRKKIDDKEFTDPEVLDIIVKRMNEDRTDLFEIIKQLIKELYDDGKTDVIKLILKDLGFDDTTIEELITDYQKIIDGIKKKIDDKEFTEQEVIDIIKKRMEEDKNKPKEEEPSEPSKPSEPAEPTKPQEPSGESKTEIDVPASLNVIFENIELLDGSASNILPVLVDNKNISFNIVLDAPGDYYAFTVDIKNNSNIDVKVDNVTSTVLTEEQDKYLGFSLTYEDGTRIYKDDVIKVGENRKVKFVSLYKYVDDINTHDVTANYNGQITFVQN